MIEKKKKARIRMSRKMVKVNNRRISSEEIGLSGASPTIASLHLSQSSTLMITKIVKQRSKSFMKTH